MGSDSPNSSQKSFLIVHVLYVRMHTYKHTHAHAHVYVHTHAHAHACTYTHIYTHTCTHACMHIHMHTYIHVHMHAHIYACRNIVLVSLVNLLRALSKQNGHHNCNKMSNGVETNPIFATHCWEIRNFPCKSNQDCY